MTLGMYILRVWGTQLLGSGILSFIPCAMRGHTERTQSFDQLSKQTTKNEYLQKLTANICEVEFWILALGPCRGLKLVHLGDMTHAEWGAYIDFLFHFESFFETNYKMTLFCRCSKC